MNLKKSSLLLAALLSLSTFVASSSFAVPTDPTNTPTDPVTTPTDPTIIDDNLTPPLELDPSNSDANNPIPNKVSVASLQLINITLPTQSGGLWCYTVSNDNLLLSSNSENAVLQDMDPTTGEIIYSHTDNMSFMAFTPGKVTLTFHYIYPVSHELSSLKYSFTLDVVE